jgi:excisionase family DNA binding protein
MLAEEVAECLRVTSDQVYRYARKKELPHYKLGKNVRFNPKDVYQWASENIASSRFRTSW